MKRWKKILWVGVLFVVAPILCTICMRQIRNRDAISFSDEEEEQLLYMMAAEISPECEMETLKMQAVIERTRYKKAQAEDTSQPRQLSPQELVAKWGSRNYSTYYEKFQEAIIATSGEVITCDGVYIYPEFHYLSNGKTRSMEEVYGRTEFAYLKSVDSGQDLDAPEYLDVWFITKEEFQKKCQETWNLPGEKIENITLDSAGYVKELVLDGRAISGEEMQKLLDLSSCCFSIRESGDSYRIVTKGIGHGFGVSIYGANEMAKMGATYRSILEYYYSGIQISAE